MSYLASHLPQIGELTVQHLALVFAGLGLGLLVALPLGTAPVDPTQLGPLARIR